MRNFLIAIYFWVLATTPDGDFDVISKLLMIASFVLFSIAFFKKEKK